eukprot:8047669-Lingulodinium_polyedra.AAC.1
MYYSLNAFCIARVAIPHPAAPQSGATGWAVQIPLIDWLVHAERAFTCAYADGASVNPSAC